MINLLFSKKISLHVLINYAACGYIASLISFLLTWIWQGNSGMSLYISNFGIIDMVIDLLIFPIFSYSFLLFPIAAGVSGLIFKNALFECDDKEGFL